MPERLRKPNRTTERVYNKRPRHRKPKINLTKRVEDNLGEYRKAAAYILELVSRIEV